MSGSVALLVDFDSATHNRSWESRNQFRRPLNRTHSDLVKFSKHDHEYSTVYRYLFEFSKTAYDIVGKRFSGEASKETHYYDLKYLV